MFMNDKRLSVGVGVGSGWGDVSVDARPQEQQSAITAVTAPDATPASGMRLTKLNNNT